MNPFNPFEPSMMTPFPGMAALTNRPVRPTIDLVSMFAPVAAGLQDYEKTKQQEADREKERAQRAAIAAGEQNVQMRGQDINEQARKDTNARMDKDKAQAVVLALTTEYAGADPARKAVILQQLQELGGLQMTEHASNYQAPEQVEDVFGRQVPRETPTQVFAGPQAGQATPYDAETGGLGARARNPTTGAVGVGQDMPGELRAAGYDPAAVAKMTPEQQAQADTDRLTKVHGFTPERVAAVRADPGENYLATVAPAFAGKNTPDPTVIYRKGSKEYEAPGNAALWDVNKDGQITASEIRQRGREGAGSQLRAAAGGPPAPGGEPAPRDLGDLDSWAMQQRLGADIAGRPPTAEPGPAGPMPWEELGLPGPRMGPTGEQVVPGGGRFIFTDPKTGKVAFELDSKAMLAQQQKTVEDGIAPLLANSPPEFKPIAQQVTALGKSLVGQGFTPKEAQETAIAEWNKMTGQQISAQKGAGSGEFQQQKAFQADADRAIRDTVSQYKLGTITQGDRYIDEGLAALKGENGLGDVVAVRKLMTEIGGRTTDVEFNSIANSSGWLNTMENWLNNKVTGRLTPDMTASLRNLLQNQKAINEAKKKEAAETAAERVRSGSPYPVITDAQRTQAVDRARNAVLGFQPPATAAPGAPTSNEDLLKNLMGTP